MAYCLTCVKEFGEVKPEHQCDRFICPNDNPEEPQHITSVAIGPEGRFWAKIQSKILHYELYRSPIRWFNSWWGIFKGRSGIYLIVRFFIILLCLILSAPFTNELKTKILNITLDLVLLIIIFDIIIATTSCAFISRYYSVPFRSVLLTSFSFIQLVIAFSVFYFQLGNQFQEIIRNQFQALYFSFVTITTLGYGDFLPNLTAWHIQSIVILQLILGLYFLLVMLSIITNWVNILPAGIPTKNLKDILVSCNDEEKGKI